MSRPALRFRSERCEAVDPLEVFAAAGSAPRFFWEQPAARRFRVGVGCAARVTSRARARSASRDAAHANCSIGSPGKARDRASRTARRLCIRADAGSNGLWQGFPDGELRLPEVAYSREGDVRTGVCRGSRWLLQPAPCRSVIRCVAWSRSATVVRRPTWSVSNVSSAEIRGGPLQKVVLARAVHVTARSTIDPVAWLVALRSDFPPARCSPSVRATPCSSAPARSGWSGSTAIAWRPPRWPARRRAAPRRRPTSAGRGAVRQPEERRGARGRRRLPAVGAGGVL